MLRCRRAGLAASLLGVVMVILSCGKNGSQQTANQNANRTAGAKVGRWLVQFKPAAATPENLENYQYGAISVLSSSTVFVAGDMPNPKIVDQRVGVVAGTTDGGRTWKETPIDPPSMQVPQLNAVHFVNPQTGWAVGINSLSQGVIVKTSDGGVTWTAAKLPGKQAANAVFFIDANRGWVGGITPRPDKKDSDEGGPSTIYATSDGGNTWQPQLNLPISIYNIFFVDSGSGWAGGTDGAIYHTVDGGQTWNKQKSEIEPALGDISSPFHILQIQFLDHQHGYAAAEDEDASQGRVLATDNGGVTWTKVLLLSSGSVKSLYFLNPSEGWAAIQSRDQSAPLSYIYRTVDGGRAWLTEPKASERDLTVYRLGGADAGHVWGAAGGAIYYHSD